MSRFYEYEYTPERFGLVGQFAPAEAARVLCCLKRGGEFRREQVQTGPAAYLTREPGAADFTPVSAAAADWLLRRCWVRLKDHCPATGRTVFGVGGSVMEGYQQRRYPEPRPNGVHP